MFGLKYPDLVLVMFVVFGFFLAKMLSSKKEGYAPFDCTLAKSKDCCLGGQDKIFSSYCSWKENSCTWAADFVRDDDLKDACMTANGQVGKACNPSDPYDSCCAGESCPYSGSKQNQCTPLDSAAASLRGLERMKNSCPNLVPEGPQV